MGKDFGGKGVKNQTPRRQAPQKSIDVPVIPAKAGIQLRKLCIQVVPSRIRLFDQGDLPGPFPILDRFLPRDGTFHRVVGFILD